jgi:hypothetical protein
MLRDTPRNETPKKNRAEAQLVLLLPPPNRTQPLDRLSRVEPGDIGHVEELDHFHAQLRRQLGFRATGLLGLRAAAPNQAVQ